MSTTPVKLCMVGAGNHASRNIYPCFHFLGDSAQVVANCDLDLGKARSTGRPFGINRHYTDLQEMLEKEQPDGVIVCIGSTLHYRLALQIMKAGAHVYVEKPHADTVEQSVEMLECSIATRKICMGAYKKRFVPAYREAKRLLDAGKLGTPTFLQLLRSMGGGSANNENYLWQWGCHGTDLVPYLFGDIVQVQAIQAHNAWKSVAVNIEFASGATGQMAIGSPGGAWEKLLVLGDGMGALSVENTVNLTVFDGDNPSGGRLPSWTHGMNSTAVEMGYVGELQEFVQAIAENRQPEANIAHCSHTVAFHCAIMESLQQHKPVAVQAFDPSALPSPSSR